MDKEIPKCAISIDKTGSGWVSDGSLRINEVVNKKSIYSDHSQTMKFDVTKNNNKHNFMVQDLISTISKINCEDKELTIQNEKNKLFLKRLQKDNEEIIRKRNLLIHENEKLKNQLMDIKVKYKSIQSCIFIEQNNEGNN